MHLLSKEQSILPRESIQNAFLFSELCPFFDLDFLSSIKHPTAERWHPHVMLLLICLLSLVRCQFSYVRSHKYYINPFPNRPLFLRVCSKNLLATLSEKDKLLVTSNFSFSLSVFYPFGELSAIVI